MFALIRKDLIACRLFLVFGLAIYALYAVSAYQQPLGYFMVNIGAIILLVMTPIVVDEKYRADTLVCYLPPSRSKVVLARYVMALIALLSGLGLHYGLGAILSIRFEETGFWTLCAPQAVLAFCIVPVALVSLYLPCFFRFGLGRGSFVFVALIAALTILVTSPLVTIDLLSANGGFVLRREMIQHPELALVALIDHVSEAVSSGRFCAVVSIGSVALVSASLALSIRFFQRRDF
jgi:hypothetical protein